MKPDGGAKIGVPCVSNSSDLSPAVGQVVGQDC